MKKFLYLIYLLFFKNTPEDYRPYALFFPWVRSFLVRNYLKKCGKKPNVKQRQITFKKYCVSKNYERKQQQRFIDVTEY